MTLAAVDEEIAPSSPFADRLDGVIQVSRVTEVQMIRIRSLLHFSPIHCARFLLNFSHNSGQIRVR
jgi:hypothetical protein